MGSSQQESKSLRVELMPSRTLAAVLSLDRFLTREECQRGNDLYLALAVRHRAGNNDSPIRNFFLLTPSRNDRGQHRRLRSSQSIGVLCRRIGRTKLLVKSAYAEIPSGMHRNGAIYRQLGKSLLGLHAN